MLLSPLLLASAWMQAPMASLEVTANPFVSMIGASNYADTDHDGLPDDWETGGHGPLNPSVHGCNPRHADLIMVVVLRPGMARRTVQPSIDRMRRFWASVPGTNPDGTIGINLITVWGNILPSSATSSPYQGLYDAGVPEGWRDMAHAYLAENGEGGGGNTVPGRNWSAGGYYWSLWTHEIGHQLGLNHTPNGFSTFSPVYGSMMNYDYQGSFNGDPEAVQFSRGGFASLRLRESNLTETIALPLADVQFLSQIPYNFTMEARGASSTAIDWNRNGRFGESGIRADISDGSSVHIGPELNISKIVGAPALVALGDSNLLTIFPELAGGATNSTTRGLSTTAPGRLRYVTNNGRTTSAAKTLVTGGVTGEFSALTTMNKLFVAFKIGPGWSIEVRKLDLARNFPRESLMADLRAPNMVPTIGSIPVTGGRLVVFLWDQVTKEVKYQAVTYSDGAQIRLGPVRDLRIGLGTTAPSMRSQTPVAVVYNPVTSRLNMLTTGTYGGQSNRILMTPIGLIGSSDYYGEAAIRWLGGSGGNECTLERPAVLCEPGSGLLRVYFKPVAPGGVDDQNVIVLSRQLADRGWRDGWRERDMVDVWNTSRSGPAAAYFRGETAFAFRWFGRSNPDPNHDNTLHLHLKASGIDSEVYGDYDDVTHIFTRGLHESLGR